MKFILTSFLFFSSLLGAETRLAILGSGTPNPDPQRMGSSYAVIVNDNAYLVDFGPGVIRRAAELSPNCLLYTSPSPRDGTKSRMPSSA